MGKMIGREKLIKNLRDLVDGISFAAADDRDEAMVTLFAALDFALKATEDPKKLADLQKALHVLNSSPSNGPDAGEIFDHVIKENLKNTFNKN